MTIKVTFNEGAAFYTLNGDNLMYDAATVKTKVETGIFNLPTVGSALKAAVKEVADKDVPYEYEGKIVVNFDTPTAAANSVNYTATFTITPKVAHEGSLTEAAATTKGAAVTAAIADVKSSFVISYYEGGASYYNVRIKHFGDYETPWTSTLPFNTVIPGESVQQIYGVGATPDKSAERFLGRYGVVRDNWYKLQVNAIKHIGTAEPTSVTDKGTPDDEIENWIAVHVHILPWVLRNQDVTL